MEVCLRLPCSVRRYQVLGVIVVVVVVIVSLIKPQAHRFPSLKGALSNFAYVDTLEWKSLYVDTLANFYRIYDIKVKSTHSVPAEVERSTGTIHVMRE